MSRALNTERSAMVVLLVVLGVWMTARTATAEPPATKSDPAAASGGATAIEKAAKDNK
jgi:hypothetical protein